MRAPGPCLVLILLGCNQPIIVAEIGPSDARRDRDGEAASDTRIGSGLRGEYHNNVNLTGAPVLVRIDPRLDMTWSQVQPGPGVPVIFSARWHADLQAEVTGVHTLRLDSDDGSRLWIDGRLLIDQWKGAPNDRSTNIDLVAGQRYTLRAELYSSGGSGHIRLRWSAPGLPIEVVPQARFFPAL